MPVYTVCFKLGPPGTFGLPDGDMIVRHGVRSPKVEGPAYTANAAFPIGHGSLSDYRNEDEKIVLERKADSLDIRIDDNFVFVEQQATNPVEAGKLADEVLGLLLAWTSMELRSHGHLYRELLGVFDEKGNHVGGESRTVLRARWYNPQELQHSVEASADALPLVDEALSKALKYFHHACFLTSLLTGDLSEFDKAMLQCSAYLHAWKALTVLVGDPSKDRDYQSRPKALGLGPDFWEKELKPLKRIRDEADVAHYTLEETKLNDVSQGLPKLLDTFAEVAGAYVSKC